MSVEQQRALDSLYALDNILTVRITMSQGDWDAVRTEQPAGGPCNFDWSGDSRYSWRKATSVELSGTSFPAATTFTDVGIKKKSFCGSINSDKPCRTETKAAAGKRSSGSPSARVDTGPGGLSSACGCTR